MVKVDEILEKTTKKPIVFCSENKLINFKQTGNVLVSEHTVLKRHCLCVCCVCLCVYMSEWMGMYLHV